MIHLDIADAVVALLNVAGLSADLNASRTFTPLDRAEISTLTTRVIPGPMSEANQSRASIAEDYAVDVELYKPYEGATLDQADIDATFGLIQEIRDRLRDTTLATAADAQQVKTETVPNAESGYAQGHIDSLAQFTGILRITYRVRRSR